MDLPGCIILHGQHNALVHDQRGPVLEPPVSDEVRPKQDTAKSDTENCVRVAVVDSDEFAIEPNVFKSKFFKTFYT